ncbi:NB-ARC domain-containing protein [Spirillospora sp. NBC_00431]
MEFNVLGPIEVLIGAENIVPTAPKPRQVMALLTLRRNGLVQLPELIDELWRSAPPKSAMTTLQTYIYKLRKTLAAHDAEDLLVSRAGGYMLAIPDSSTDVHAFERDAADGQRHLAEESAARASELLGRALARWRGPALADVTLGDVLSPYATRLEELRRRTLELRIEADLQLGYHRELISELKSLVLMYPLNEQLHKSLMISLHRSGRRNEALEGYRNIRNNMIEEIGLEPSEELRELHQNLLLDTLPQPPPSPVSVTTATPSPAALAITGMPPPDTGGGDAVPAQLPPAAASFTGRAATIATLYENLAPEASGDGSLPSRIVEITGMPGIGKTALALCAAHRLRESYPSGQLYVEFSTADDDITDPGAVLYGFLRALDVPGDRIPVGREERSQLFRSVSTGRRLLLVLDNVPSNAAVQPLLPGDPGCAVLITSRQRLHGLVDAQKVELDGLTSDEGVGLLAHMIGYSRVAKERLTAARIVEFTDGIPLALRGIGARLAMTPGLSLTAFADKLMHTPHHELLEEFRVGDLDIRPRYATVYNSLSPQEQSAFRFLSMFPGHKFTVSSTARLLGWDLVQAKRVLDVLADYHLIRIVGVTNDVAIYTCPRLVVSFAAERLMTILTKHPLQDEENGHISRSEGSPRSRRGPTVGAG